MSVPKRKPPRMPLKPKIRNAGDVRRAKNRAAIYRGEDKATGDINRRLNRKKK